MFAKESNLCRDLWSSLNYALKHNDANTERDYRITVNLVYGLLISVATGLVFYVISNAMLKQLKQLEIDKENANAPPATSPHPINFGGLSSTRPTIYPDLHSNPNVNGMNAMEVILE